MNYEESINRLQEIVELLSNEKLPLEESLKLYEEGIKLTNECYKTLKEAEQKITILKTETDTEDE